MTNPEILQKIVSLTKRRGFVFQSSEIYGGLKSAYDYGPLGVELKRNIAAEWWRAMVHEREDVVGIDASILMHPHVWRASGHLAGFSDPLVDCHNCKERFRADKAPKRPVGQAITWIRGGRGSGQKVAGTVGSVGYVCPHCGSSDLSAERQFNLMFRTSIGPVDPIEGLLDEIEGARLSRAALKEKLENAIKTNAIYLRPETAQAMFVQFLNVQQTMSMTVPFGIAQQGKSFRNEVTTEKFIFRTCEFEQMEMEYFCEPGTQAEWLTYWTHNRLTWWRRYANNPAAFRLRQHQPDELAHYADNCFDIEFEYPWGWDELEGVASRTDYDLSKHAQEAGVKLTYFDQSKVDPVTGKQGVRYTPYVIEPAAGLTRACLAYLCDAYREEESPAPDGTTKTRVILKLNPRLAPYKVAVLPLYKKEGMPEVARRISAEFYKAGINSSFDDQQSIGKRYARHDEIGTPYCITVDHQSTEDNTVTIRDRDTTAQERISVDAAIDVVRQRLHAS